MNEMGFYFPLRPVSSQGLSRLFAECGIGGAPDDVREKMERLHFNTVSGYMRGFMDMVFQYNGRYFLVDWKSNFLGKHTETYNHEALLRVMSGSFYLLQYHLYTMALHRYLSTRMADYHYSRHFGGVYYLFLRGIDPAFGPTFGVYYDLPKQKIVEALCSSLIADI
jgi:exodeoxyribonuclease V beta subunit